MNRDLINNKKGTALFMTLMVLTSALVVALGAAALVVPGIAMNRMQANSTKAFFAAEAGAEKALWLVRKNGFNSVGCVTGNNYMRDDIYECGPYDSTSIYDLTNNASYFIEYSESGGEITLTSSGRFADTRRRVENVF